MRTKNNKNSAPLKTAILSGIGLSILPFQAAFTQVNDNISTPDNINLLADDIVYDDSGKQVTAQGHVNITADTNAIWADNLLYNTETGKMQLQGNVIFSKEKDITLFLDNLEVTDDLKKGVLENLKLRIGEDGPALTATQATMDGKTIALEDANYTACKACADGEDADASLPWKIRADKISYNGEDKNVTYKNAFLDIYGVPVLYLPYFKHPVGKREGQSGLLPPRFGSSTSRGHETTLAYHYRQSENQDYTFRTRYMSERGVQLQAEERHIGTNSASDIRGSIISDDLNSELRSHLNVQASYTFKPGKRLGVNAEIVSDDTYLDDFFNRNPNYLPATVFAEDTSRNHYYGVQGTFYNDLRTDVDPATTAQALPHFQFERTFDMEKDSTLTLSGDILSLYRSEGDQYRRLVTEASYERPIMFNNGQKITLNAKLRADTYHVEGAGADADGFSSRALPEVSINWEAPMISSGGHHTITPKAMAVLAPRGGNPADIPNEDSVAYELDISNLFDTNRFAGEDRIESGPRFVYGIDNHWGSANKTRYRLFLGQSYRMFNDETLPTSGGAQTKISDWVGQTDIKPVDWVTLGSRFRLDNADLEPKRMDTSLILGTVANDKDYISLTHTLLDGGPKEVSGSMRYNINDAFALEGHARRDLSDDGKLLLSEGSLIYTQHCYRLSFTARRRGFDNRNVRPSTDYLFNVELLTLGRDYD